MQHRRRDFVLASHDREREPPRKDCEDAAEDDNRPNCHEHRRRADSGVVGCCLPGEDSETRHLPDTEGKIPKEAQTTIVANLEDSCLGFGSTYHEERHNAGEDDRSGGICGAYYGQQKTPAHAKDM